MRKGILLLSALLLLAFVNYGIGQREHLLEKGQVVLLELAPVDPRSLMQGDYMMLRFAIDDALPQAEGEASAAPPPRFAHVALDAEGRASLVAVARALPAAPEQVGMRIRSRDGRYSIGPNAFFFQEGTAAAFEAARWGEFRVAPDGTALLTHLRDEALNRLGAQRR